MDENGEGQLFWRSELNIRPVQKSIKRISPIRSASEFEILERFFRENRALESSQFFGSNDDDNDGDLTGLFPLAKSPRPNESGLRSTKTTRVSPSRRPSQVSRIPSDAERTTAIEVGETVLRSKGEEEDSALFDSAEKSTRPAADELKNSVPLLLDLFPFHLVVESRSGCLVRVGPALLPLLMTTTPSEFSLLRSGSFAEFFRLIYPVKNLPDVFDLLDLSSGPHTAILEMKSASSDFRGVVLKGEISIVAAEEESTDNYLLLLLFPLLKPDAAVMSNAVDRDLARRSRDLADVTRRTSAESDEKTRLRRLLDATEDQMSRFEAEKSKTDGLLCSIFPASVVERLRLGRMVHPVTFDPVTVLFADIVQFTALCGDVHVTPMDVVRMLNHLYTKFDLLSSLNEVYKVETIGDAYMVVGGFPVSSSSHADVSVLMAFEMIRESETVVSPVSGQSLQIRIGIHSGACVAGVVGHLMPRYCLFGRTVALASKMETFSGPGMINISEDTQRCLSQPEVYEFEENYTLPEDIPFRSFFISRTPSSPVLHRLDVPEPRGMFRTPQPTPHTSPAKHSPRQTSFDDSLFRFPDERDATNDLSFESIARDSSPFQPSLHKHLSVETATGGLASRQSSCQPTPPLGSPRESWSHHQTTSIKGFPSMHNVSSCIQQLGSSTRTHKSTDDCSCVRQNSENAIRVESRLCNAVHSLGNERFPESLETSKTAEQSLYCCSSASHKMTQSFPKPPQQQNMYTALSIHIPEIRLNGLPLGSETEERTRFLPSENYDFSGDDLTTIASLRSPTTWPLCTCKESARCLSPDTADSPWAEHTDGRKRVAGESESIINRESSGHSEFYNSVSFANSSHTEILSKEELQRFRHSSRLVLYFHSVGISPTDEAPCWTNGRTDDGLSEFMNGCSDGDPNI